MDQESEAIRQQMEETRASLSEKLETLEQEVRGTVQQATSAVTETVENVKEAVHETVATVKDTVTDTVETVRETFDLSRQVDRHPWAMLGGSVALGFLGGYLLKGSRTERSRRSRAVAQPPAYPTRFSAGAPRNGGMVETLGQRAPAREAAPPAGPAETGWLHELSDKFAPEIAKLKGLAIGTAMGVLRDAITSSMSGEMKPQLREVIDNLTTKLGGHPIHGPIFGASSSSTSGGEGHHERYQPIQMGRPLEAAH
jgi:ElaB/YqjD/DUF883 family membrane-anchored ribosome-binding protein